MKLSASGILLAGGKSSRMKRNKAFLELEGQSLAERSLDILQRIFSEVLISSNHPDLYSRFKVPVIQDERLEHGPLEGLYQGLKAASNDVVFFVACDMPFIQEDLIRHLAGWSFNYDIVVPRLHSGLHPLHAYYQRRCLSSIKKNLEAGHLKIADLYQTCSVRYVEETELRGFTNLTKIFSNINTPEEWSGILKQ